MASEIEIETEKSQKFPKTQEKDTGRNNVVPVMLAFYYTYCRTAKERSIYRSRVCINSKEYENVMTFRRHFIGPPWVLGSWGEWLFIFREMESTGNYFQGFRE